MKKAEPTFGHRVANVRFGERRHAEPFTNIGMTKKELPHKVLQKNKQSVLESYMPIIKKEINSEVHKFKDNEGKFIRYYAEGSVAFCKDLKQYVCIDGYDPNVGYMAKVKDRVLER